MVGIATVRKVKTYVDTLRIEAVNLEEWANSIGSHNVGRSGFSERMVELIEDTETLFVNAIPKESLTFGAVTAAKRELTIACDEVARANDGIMRFHELTAEVTDGIMAMGGALDELFRSLSITTHVPIIGIVEPPVEKCEEMPEVVLVDPETTKACESCDRLRSRLKKLETALTDTSMLFKNRQ
jgi:hypothetical protein